MHSRRTVVLASTALVAATLATLLAAAVAVAPALAHHLVEARGVSGSEPLSPRAAGQPLRRGETFVTVLNASGRPGAAQDAAGVLQRLGYVVASVGNTRGPGATVVLYRRGHAREGLRLAHDLGLTAARPLAGLRPAQLLGAQLALVLGT
jgi:hypothetical protein